MLARGFCSTGVLASSGPGEFCSDTVTYLNQSSLRFLVHLRDSPVRVGLEDQCRAQVVVVPEDLDAMPDSQAVVGAQGDFDQVLVAHGGNNAVQRRSDHFDRHAGIDAQHVRHPLVLADLADQLGLAFFQIPFHAGRRVQSVRQVHHALEGFVPLTLNAADLVAELCDVSYQFLQPGFRKIQSPPSLPFAPTADPPARPPSATAAAERRPAWSPGR